MRARKKILIVEDQATTAKYFRKILEREAYDVFLADNGLKALELLKNNRIDCIVTDWMMPEMDGLELINETRKSIRQAPLIIMITARASREARTKALECGADEFLNKPVQSEALIKTVRSVFKRQELYDKPVDFSIKPKAFRKILPPFPAVVIAASTGGPGTLFRIMEQIKSNSPAAFYIVQHGPGWMLESFARRISEVSKLPAQLASNKEISRPGIIYLAPGDLHLIIDKAYRTIYSDTPPENFIKPAADPLFRTAGKYYGEFCLGVILTGLGRDGTKGAAEIYSFGGKILVQDPATAIAPPMPRSIVNSGIPHEMYKVEKMGNKINEYVEIMNFNLKKIKKSAQ